jgi:sorting nexin-25
VPKLAPGDNERKFERFIRSIRLNNSLAEARRFRSEVTSQLKRDSIIPGQDQTYLKRLETGKRMLDQRVAHLSSTGHDSTKPQPLSVAKISSRLENATLTDILHDASGLSYFMEFMDRQNRMTSVQFWLVVDGFRNPLEDDIDEDEESLTNPPSWTESDRMDLAQINEAYLSKKELKIPDISRDVVSAFLKAGKSASPLQYQKARGAILRGQTAVLEDMQSHYFPKFKTSDLFYKYLATDEAGSRVAAREPSPTRSPPDSPLQATQSRSRNHPAAPKLKLPVNRAVTQVARKNPDLRRAAASSADLSSIKDGATDGAMPTRRSFDSTKSNPLFDDDYDDDPLSRSRQSLGSDTNADSPADQADVIDTMEAALTNIMENAPSAEEDAHASLFEDSPEPSLFGNLKEKDSPRSSLDIAPNSRDQLLFGAEKGKVAPPTLASLGLVSTYSRGTVFQDDLFPAEARFSQDDEDDPDGQGDEVEAGEEIHEAAPGDLGLAEAIEALSSDIDRLTSQEAVVESLQKKAELTNNTGELRILGKSKSSLQREIRRKELQRQQYIVQESDNSLFGRSTLRIASTLVQNEGGKEYALYVIEVQRNGSEQMRSAKWAIARRYSEFHDLHQRLRNKYHSVRLLDFPRRRVVMKLQRDFLDKRRQALEQYLKELLLLPDVCRSRDLRAFLSQQAILSPELRSEISPETRTDIMSRIYNSVADGMEDILGNIPVLDQLSVAGQSIITAAANQLAPPLQATVLDDPSSIAEAEAELEAFENRELEPFVKPICDIFLEIFELNRGNNWLRGRAVVVVLHQLLGGTIERKIRESAKGFFQEDSVLKCVAMLRENMWPDGKLRNGSTQRTTSDKSRSRTEASLMLATLVPDMAGGVVGRANAQAASRRMFATFNNERLK